MKRYPIICIIAASALLILTSCNKEQEPVTKTAGDEILLNSFAQTMVAARATQNLQSSQFDNGENLSVFINEKSSGAVSTTYPQPIRYTTNGSGGMSTSTKSYFPQSGNAVTIYACYPSSAATQVSTTVDFTVQNDQTSDANYKLSDLMQGTPAGGNPVKRTSQTTTLTFKHLLSKINISLEAGAGLSDSDLEGAVVKLKTILPTIAFNPTSGLSGAAKGSATVITVMRASGSRNGSVIIAPQSLTNGAEFIEVTLASGGVLSYKLANATTFDSACQYDYRITVKLTALEVGPVTISDWTSGGSPIQGEANL